MLLWHPSKAKRWAEDLGLAFGPHRSRIFEAVILFSSLFKREIWWAWHWISSSEPCGVHTPGCVRGFLGGEWECWKHQAHRASASKKKKNHFKIRLELCRNPNCRGCSRKAEGWIDPFLDWADFLFLFFFNPVPTASIPPRKPGAPPGPQLDRRTAEGPRCATRRESSPGCPRLCRELQQREIPDLFAAFVYNTQPNDKVKAVFLSVFLSARVFDGSCFHRIISWKKSTTVCCAIPQVDWIILKYFGQWSWNFDLTVINISFAGNINATACFFHGAALIWSHFLVCFGFGKAQIFFFWNIPGLYEALMCMVSIQNVLTSSRPICMCSCLLVLTSELHIQGSFPCSAMDVTKVPCHFQHPAGRKGWPKTKPLRDFQVFF